MPENMPQQEWEKEPNRNIVPFAELQKLTANYRETVCQTETQHIWFSVEDIMTLIKDNKANGIKIYLGRYDNDHPYYAGHLTVALVATRDEMTPDKPTQRHSVDMLDPAKHKCDSLKVRH
ncbi:hypothetical protein FRZ67_11405 [Panacibacter ginsenosidivorans]|uniref:Uncharacterized protein n=1 Tax=Panacibacter ginsenosidivorans TaxID=1813871 RepID=A0A5B8V9Q1_9BACT|nr:hypothetical protein [Panacibacter ginsenosidivorans]QEC67875.1 hypothetical protein FRZ67_11405 [Panacibacter ginsenosidivorans]